MDIQKKSVLQAIIFATILIIIVILSSNLISVTGNTITEIKEEDFNLKIDVPSEYQEIKKGERIWFTIKILNLANQERVDVQLVYNLLDDKNEVVTTKKETVAIETQASFVGNLEIPKETKKGSYTLQVQMISANGDISQGHTSVTVSSTKDIMFFLKNYYIYIIIVAIVILVIIILIRLKPVIKKSAEKRKIKSRIKSIINKKIKTKKVTKEELEESKLPKQKKVIDDSKEKKYY